MERDIDMNEVSDGRLYGLRDMVKAAGAVRAAQTAARAWGVRLSWIPMTSGG